MFTRKIVVNILVSLRTILVKPKVAQHLFVMVSKLMLMNCIERSLLSKSASLY